MKKLIALLSAFLVIVLIACGPSAEDNKKMEEQLQKAADSTANALLQKASTAASDTSKPNVVAPTDTTKK